MSESLVAEASSSVMWKARYPGQSYQACYRHSWQISSGPHSVTHSVFPGSHWLALKFPFCLIWVREVDGQWEGHYPSASLGGADRHRAKGGGVSHYVNPMYHSVSHYVNPMYHSTSTANSFVNVDSLLQLVSALLWGYLKKVLNSFTT